MSARDYAAKRLHEFANPVSAVVVDAEDVIDAIMKAIKEELAPKDQTFKEFFGLDKKPQLIQGYTAEQWQEIIDGGYLCEFSGSGNKSFGPLESFKDGSYEYPFQQGEGSNWSNCRLAQIKGVMRPIFVEPVDKEAGYVFFDRRGSYLGTSNFFTGATWNETIGCCMSSDCTPTKYIEL